jgi:hypothetical protein
MERVYVTEACIREEYRAAWHPRIGKMSKPKIERTKDDVSMECETLLWLLVWTHPACMEPNENCEASAGKFE